MFKQSVLVLLMGINQMDAVTGLVIIQKQLALGNANEVANLKLNTTRTFAKATFYVNHTWLSCGVNDYILHPEYYAGVKNTLALVILNCEKDVHWNSVGWPTEETKLDYVYNIGLTDRHYQLQQYSNEMEAVKNDDCEDFYRKEKLYYESLQPTHTVCYKVLNSKEECVVDAGMALAARSKTDIWTLIGISTFGPGCSLPSRFIQFFPYIRWIRSQWRPIETRKDFARINYRSYDWNGMRIPYEDLDKYIIERVDDSTIVMRPTLANVTETVHGRCEKDDGQLIYKESGTIKMPKHTAVGVYAISLYDLLLPKVTCVMVTVKCRKRSRIGYTVSEGFHQEDIEHYVKIVPTLKRYRTKPPKIQYLKDYYEKYRSIETTALSFKFEFQNEARFDLVLYGQSGDSALRAPQVKYLLKEQTSDKPSDEVEYNTQNVELEDLDTNDSFYHI